MENTPTPHISALPGDIAGTVLMPGDPLRAKFIAEQYLTDCSCFNQVRNMLGFTGTYQGKRISVMGSGMGMPSMGIYSYELFQYYSVSNIIRIGSAGGIADGVQIKDIILGMGACTDSGYSAQYGLGGSFSPIADFALLRKAVEAAEDRGVPVKVGNVLSTDVFYHTAAGFYDKWKEMGILGAEMETAALYMNAAKLNKKALALFTVSDHLYTGESLSAEERQTSFRDMMEIALQTALRL